MTTALATTFGASSNSTMTDASAMGAKAPHWEATAIDEYLAGDEHALDEIVTTYQTKAFWVARHVVRHDEVAQDIVQEAFVRVLRKHHLYDRKRSFQNWFLQIVRNLAIDHLRRSRTAPMQEMVEVQGESIDLSADLQAQERHQRIQVCLDAMPENYRELIVLREIEGISPRDIAEQIGVDYGTARWRIHHARKLFKQEWLNRYGSDDHA
jgi:RNA polymerase sigma-70 factor (ECF subfamily)